MEDFRIDGHDFGELRVWLPPLPSLPGRSYESGNCLTAYDLSSVQASGEESELPATCMSVSASERSARAARKPRQRSMRDAIAAVGL